MGKMIKKNKEKPGPQDTTWKFNFKQNLLECLNHHYDMHFPADQHG